jgi:hypothetical protein
MIPFLTVDEVIERAILMIANHPLFRDPIVLNEESKPIRINHIRDFDGFISNPNGLTLSIFPYSYQGASNESIASQNAALVYEPYTLGGATEGFDRCRLSLVVKLQAQGTQRSKMDLEPPPNKVVIERSKQERALHRWLTILRAILLTNPVGNLAGLVKNSTVNWGSFRTSTWNASPGSTKGGENLVFHQAALLWQIELYAPRNWREIPQRIALPNTSPTSSWLYVGVRTRDCFPIYWDTFSGFLVTLEGFPLRTTPQGLTVTYNPDTKQLTKLDGTPLTNAEKQDTTQTPAKVWIDQNLLIVGVLAGNQNLFFNQTTNQLQTCTGTIVTQLPDGTPVTYDPGTGTIKNPTTGAPLSPSAELLPLKAGLVNIYDANALELRDTFEI